jgi:ubiquinone/menaquinone biosynthesis C-methylase UbiE
MREQGDHLGATRAYYDDFSARYDDRRGGRDPGGYHDLIDDLEVELVARYGAGREVLEVGCGTGLLLERFARFAERAVGVDLSPGMLEKARARGLDVMEGSATKLPYPDASFDVVCSFKVLAHVAPIREAMAEMARVTRPGGIILAELYNPWSLRGLAKRLGPAGAISATKDEGAVFTRFDTPFEARRLAPQGTRFVGARGVRIVTPAARVLGIPVLGSLLKRAEHALCDTPLRALAGFYVVILKRV